MLRTILAATAFAAILACQPAIAEETKMPRTISLTGHGETRLAPDLAIINAGVLTEATTAGQALAANTRAMQSLFATLKAAGIEDKDIRTSNFAVQPRYDRGTDGRSMKLSGYNVSNNVTVSVRKLDDLGQVLDQLVTAGANQINGIQFGIAKPEQALDEARKRAVEDARHKATIYAEAAGLRLGNILSLSEGTGYQPPNPMIRAAMARSDGMAAEVPIAGGEQSLSVDVNVSWEID